MARKMRKYSEDVPFSLTSMMDMMTIILVFLIKNMDAEGQLITQAENLILPISTSKVQPKEVSLSVVVDAGYVVVDNQKIIPTPDVMAQEDLLIAKVDSVLKERRATERDHALRAGLPADEAGNIIIQIDKNIPYDVMYKVMATCGFSGYTNISFAVMMKNGGEE
ncbi:MAG: biopolymer transporter ExbD [Hallerella porci]|uniref:Biopolymer transport protein ExbD n=1 Tax=Hallerella porci TaxID=1945871 RepID=A0ABX5LNB7_9BACT|nr:MULTISPECIES: biopolymer transporter ExbD [Hallerella]MCI5600973.1 biopolymer transporter ExbD [Hallerella sp.]MDY3920688.1 biopolymer transporter ExbD [Hallerella porci]PWK99188.1 biopolymer transport protein ExbD [Hallerella porci]